ncbi:unnamed protein product [Discula destructiva]
MLSNQLVVLALAIPYTLACLTGGIPKATGTKSNSAAITVKSGQTFDCAFARYDRGKGACKGQKEGGDLDAVFIVEKGATLQNCIIGADQSEGVHCVGACTLKEVWFEDVCEDAITVKGDGSGDVSNIIGGGAYKASDKVIQHNGCGKVNVVNFYTEDYGKLYRSCGNCKSQCKRSVSISGSTAKKGGTLCGINKNYGDTCTLSNNCADTKNTCTLYDGCSNGCEPKKLGYC